MRYLRRAPTLTGAGNAFSEHAGRIAAGQPYRRPRAPLLIAASKDSLVNPARNTGGLANKLRAHGVPVKEIYYDGVRHSTLVASSAAPLRSLAPTLDAIDQFARSKPELIQVQSR